MPTYYTVDRSNKLKAGAVINPDTDFSNCRFFPVEGNFDRIDLERLTKQLFPLGLTEHGKRYLLNEYLILQTPQGPAPVVPHIPMIELVFELVRRSFFPDKPSRLACIFGWEKYEEAVEFQRQHGAGTICRTEAEGFFRGDMNLLLLGGAGISAIQFAAKYWNGGSGPQPRWEVLLIPPVKVVELIEMS